MSAGYVSAMLSVVRKELLDIARDHRTLAMAVLFTPLLFPVMMLGMSSLGEMRVRTQLESELELPVIGAERAEPDRVPGFAADPRGGPARRRGRGDRRRGYRRGAGDRRVLRR